MIEIGQQSDLVKTTRPADPFDFDLGSGMHCFYESATFRDCPINTYWADNLCDEPTRERLRSRAISCAGTTIGSTMAMRRYASLVMSTLTAMGPRNMELISDQTAHNMLLLDDPSDMTCHANFAGPVATLGHAADEDLRFDAEGRLCNHDGSIVHVIHQFDRKPILQSMLHARYAMPVAATGLAAPAPQPAAVTVAG